MRIKEFSIRHYGPLSGLITASFDNVMFLFVFVFIIDLIVTSVMVKRLLSHMKVAPETESRQVPN